MLKTINSLSLIQIIIVFLFLYSIIATVWRILDYRSLKDSLKFLTNPKLFIFEAFVVFSQIIGSIIFPLPQTKLSPYLIPLGIFIFILGTLLGIWARVTMDKIWGLPAQHDIKRQNQLITAPPFSFTRNPIYLCVIFMYIGFSLSMRTWAFILIVLVIHKINGYIKKEEALLEKHFGEKYLSYKNRVPRYLIF